MSNWVPRSGAVLDDRNVHPGSVPKIHGASQRVEDGSSGLVELESRGSFWNHHIRIRLDRRHGRVRADLAQVLRERCPRRAANKIDPIGGVVERAEDRKSTRLNSSHRCISYAVFCLKKKK